MFKKSAIVASAAAGLLMIGSPAFATPDEVEDNTGQVGLVNVDDVLNENNIGVCDNNINVLGVQVTDVLNRSEERRVGKVC